MSSRARVVQSLFVAFSGLILVDVARGQTRDSRIEPWVVRFQLMWNSVHDTPFKDTDGVVKFREGVPFPVAPGLYQRMDSDSLLTLVSVLTMREGEESFTGVMNLSDDVYIDTYDDTWFLKVAIPDGRFKIVLWPDPSLWNPGTPVEEHAVAEEDSFEITGSLYLMDGGEVLSFPRGPARDAHPIRTGQRSRSANGTRIQCRGRCRGRRRQVGESRLEARNRSRR